MLYVYIIHIQYLLSFCTNDTNDGIIFEHILTIYKIYEVYKSFPDKQISSPGSGINIQYKCTILIKYVSFHLYDDDNNFNDE